MMVRVLLFGPLALELGARDTTVEVTEPATVADVNIALALRFPGRGPLLRSARLAVNSALARPDHPVHPDDEIAVIELLGGG